ncbi:MAG: glycosyltransferase [Chlamydiia bacterium]|nr:glycosyltransferase [Chlamydiia bacterium]
MNAFYDINILLEATDLTWGWIAFLFFFWIFIFFALVTFIQMLVGTIAIFSKFKKTAAEDVYTVLRSNSLPPITFIIPAYNEIKVITHTVKNLLSLSYRYKKIIIVNDGSTDETFAALKTTFNLHRVPPSFPGSLPTAHIRGYYVSNEYPNLLVIDKDNGNKADALNAGLNACETEIFVAADADTLVDDDALNRLIRPFMLNPETVVAHASIGLLNGCKIANNRILEYKFPSTLIPGLQAVDYMKSFLIERMGLSWTKGALVVPGNFGLFKTKDIVAIGGYDVTSLVEDTEIITNLHKQYLSKKIPYEITYVPDIVAWTAGPDTVEGLVKQRLRWYRGTSQNIWKFRDMCFNPKYRSIGMFVIPMTFFEKIAPLIEISGFVILFIAAWLTTVEFSIVFAFAIVSWLYVSMIIVVTVLVDTLVFETYKSWKDFGRIVKCIFAYPLYHYILLYCRLVGLYVPKKYRKGGWVPDRIDYEKVEKS